MNDSHIALPDDVWLLICEELGQRRDFDSLFRCSQTGKGLASFSLLHAYRHFSEARLRDDEVEGRGFTNFVDQQLLIQKWAIQWRSILLSTFGKTILPYHSYIRFLNLRDLRNLLDDPRFKAQVSRYFFDGELKSFHKQRKAFNRNVLEFHAILDMVGDAITSKNQSIEQLSGDFTSSAFLSWIPRLSRLQNLELWDGEVLSSAELRKSIHDHCPLFESLSVFRWTSPLSDLQLGSFVGDLPANKLKSFQNISQCSIASDTCFALSHHADSLLELELNFSDAASISALSHLKPCIMLERLALEAPVNADLELLDNQAFQEVNEWLANCIRLRSLTMAGFESSPSVLTPLLLNDRVRLHRLELDSEYPMSKHRTFHQALGQHTSLQVLSLKGSSENAVRDDIESLVNSVCQLKQLKNLRLQGVADYFADDHILRILPSLPELTEVYIGGYDLTDASLDAVLGLRKLREITFSGITRFSYDGLADLVSKLSHTNEELRLVVDMADTDYLLTDDQVATITKAIFQTVGGTFEYQAMRDPNAADSDESDSD